MPKKWRHIGLIVDKKSYPQISGAHNRAPVQLGTVAFRDAEQPPTDIERRPASGGDRCGPSYPARGDGRGGPRSSPFKGGGPCANNFGTSKAQNATPFLNTPALMRKIALTTDNAPVYPPPGHEENNGHPCLEIRPHSRRIKQCPFPQSLLP